MIPGNRIPKNAISGNNFLGYDILGVFGMQIEFLGIVDKFPKIPLREVVAGDLRVAAEGGRRLWRCRAASSGSGGRPVVAAVVSSDLWRLALGDDRGILVFLQWQTFSSHRNVGFPWGEVVMFWG